MFIQFSLSDCAMPVIFVSTIILYNNTWYWRCTEKGLRCLNQLEFHVLSSIQNSISNSMMPVIVNKNVDHREKKKIQPFAEIIFCSIEWYWHSLNINGNWCKWIADILRNNVTITEIECFENISYFHLIHLQVIRVSYSTEVLECGKPFMA